ncbi:unnamed protein product [Chondrus crispus]|uniref:Uncharacterized protein n=1 Tax=Chondrus crispus TaxID=2769 RepID=R7QBP8_CHOCR|nr:unnamed protein product [Chondrus crispus]CDF35213.1 unnamed protein product [Chondrus crispus]|eukprot:XP_005715032.1 unnamed protein product [Chondrus crispus]
MVTRVCPHDAPAMLALLKHRGRRVVNVDGMESDGAYAAFVAVAAGAFAPVKASNSRIGKLSIPGDPDVHLLWGQTVPDFARIPWDDPFTLASYADAYVMSVGAGDDYISAWSLAMAVPWAVEGEEIKQMSHWMDKLDIPDDIRYADLLPQVLTRGITRWATHA